MVTKLEKARLLLLVRKEIEELKKIVAAADELGYCDCNIKNTAEMCNEYTILYKKIEKMECE